MLHRARIVRIFLAGMLVLWLTSAAYANQRSMYQITAEVPSQSRNDRITAFSEAMGALIIKLTGTPEAASVENTQELIKNAEQYVTLYNYHTPTQQELIAKAKRFGDHYYKLDIVFDRDGVNNKLTSSGLSVWKGDRPSLLLWIVTEQYGNRTIVDDNSHSVLQQHFKRQSEKLGIPIIYPVGDLEDSASLSTSELWGLFAEPILRASQRYGTQAIVAIKAAQTRPDEYTGRMIFYFQGKQSSQEFESISASGMTHNIISFVTKRMAQFYASSPSQNDTTTIKLQLDGLNSPESYAECLNYLSNLAAVRELSVSRIQKSSVLFDVKLTGSTVKLEAMINLGRALKKRELFVKGEVNNWSPTLRYQWRKSGS